MCSKLDRTNNIDQNGDFYSKSSNIKYIHSSQKLRFMLEPAYKIQVCSKIDRNKEKVYHPCQKYTVTVNPKQCIACFLLYTYKHLMMMTIIKRTR